MESVTRKNPSTRDQRLGDLDPADFLGHVLDTMPGGLYTVDTDGRVTSWNRAMEEITGLSASEVLGQFCSFLEGDTCFGGPCSSGGDCCPLFAEGIIQGRRCTIKGRDGRPLSIMKNARLMYSPGGELLGGIEAVTDISSLVDLEHQLAQLRKEVSGRARFGRIVGSHPSMQRLYEMIEMAASVQTSVLITGATGTGKELVAKAIHQSGHRKEGPYVRVHCAALSETLLESELFGHVRGSFTGATANRKGRFEAADGGTVFLDEIGDISETVQTKLLRVLQEHEFERVGDSRTIPVDIRVITATNRDLEKLCDEGRFRRDLYYRLAVMPITVPNLRDRRSDLPLLIEHFIERLNSDLGRSVRGVTPEVMERLMAYHWPGNVRELENAVEHAFVLARSDSLDTDCLPGSVIEGGSRATGPAAAAPGPDLETVQGALDATGWNRTRAAESLGVSRVTLWKWMKKLGISGR